MLRKRKQVEWAGCGHTPAWPESANGGQGQLGKGSVVSYEMARENPCRNVESKGQEEAMMRSGLGGEESCSKGCVFGEGKVMRPNKTVRSAKMILDQGNGK
ncbi:hypothetical protein SUGI_0778540 [Cryptomeria japonica]|nr:hypothetical protein SUGI_0778540 [Cryptomeria japonica]